MTGIYLKMRRKRVIEPKTRLRSKLTSLDWNSRFKRNSLHSRRCGRRITIINRCIWLLLYKLSLTLEVQRLEGLEKENADLKQELEQAQVAASTGAKCAVEVTELRTKLDSSERAMRDLSDRYEECRVSRDSLLTDGDALEDENRLLLQQVQEMQLSMGEGIAREHAEIAQLLGTESELPERVQQLVDLADSSASLKELCDEQSHEINCLRDKLDAKQGHHQQTLPFIMYSALHCAQVH